MRRGMVLSMVLSMVRIGEWKAVYAIDWGETTGICELIVPTEWVPGEDCGRGSMNVWQCGGTNEEVVQNVMGRWEVFSRGWDSSVGSLVLVQEKYVHAMRGGLRSADAWSSGRLAAMAAGWRLATYGRHAIEVVEIAPGVSKGYATSARLREWGLWTVGMVHGRDATRVAVTYLS